MQESQQSNINVAIKHLAHSQTLMKQQYDKKLNNKTICELEKGDDVLIENTYQNQKGGKLQDRWLGPYPVAKVTQSNVHVLRNKSTQRVKRSKVKLVKRPLDQQESPPSKYQCLSNEIMTII